QFYPWAAIELDVLENRIRLGIGEGEHWPVALVGYVLNSLARDSNEIHASPFVPQLGHEYFPPRPPAAPIQSAQNANSTPTQSEQKRQPEGRLGNESKGKGLAGSEGQTT